MKKLTYIEPRLEVLLFDEKPVMVNGSYPEHDPDEPGEDLGKENTFDDSSSPRRSVWDED